MIHPRALRFGVSLATAATLLVSSSRTALAHAGEHDDGGLSAGVTAALFVAGTVVIGAAVYLDHANEIDRRLADAGVLLGIVAALGGLLGAVV